MKIVIVYELPQRELENDLLLKYYFEEKGHICELIKFPYSNPCALRKKYRNKVDVVMVHSLYDDEVINNLVYSIFGRVRYIINLQVEQIGTNKSERDITSYGCPKGCAKYAYHVCWGERSKSRLLSAGIEEKHLIKCGSIQIDFLRKEFNGYYITKEKLIERYGIDSSKSISLFISSFSYVGLPEYARKDLINKIGKQRFESFEALSTDSLKGIIQWFNKYLKEQDDTVIIYRKHPAETLSEEVKLLETRFPDRFMLISDYSVKQWILISDRILTWYSTSVAEAYFAKKSVLVLRPVNIKYEDEVSILNGMQPINTYESLQIAMKSSLFNSNLDASLVDYYDVDEKKASFVRLAEFVVNLVSTNIEPFPWKKYNTIKFDLVNMRNDIIHILYIVYKTILNIVAKYGSKFKVKYANCIEQRIKEQNEEKEKYKDQYLEIERLNRRGSELQNIVKGFATEREK